MKKTTPREREVAKVQGGDMAEAMPTRGERGERRGVMS